MVGGGGRFWSRKTFCSGFSGGITTSVVQAPDVLLLLVLCHRLLHWLFNTETIFLLWSFMHCTVLCVVSVKNPSGWEISYFYTLYKGKSQYPSLAWYLCIESSRNSGRKSRTKFSNENDKKKKIQNFLFWGKFQILERFTGLNQHSIKFPLHWNLYENCCHLSRDA